MLQSEQMTSRMIYQIYTQRLTHEQHIFMQRVSNEMVMRAGSMGQGMGFNKLERPGLEPSPSHLVYQFSSKCLCGVIERGFGEVVYTARATVEDVSERSYTKCSWTLFECMYYVGGKRHWNTLNTHDTCGHLISKNRLLVFLICHFDWSLL